MKDYLEEGLYSIIGKRLIFRNNCLISWIRPNTDPLRPNKWVAMEHADPRLPGAQLRWIAVLLGLGQVCLTFQLLAV